ncbi:MAG TPA: hypothetical protein VGO52_16370 [Hyphomonadaceae bacterium]|nr:hypothetical protein [Hyphomonadaceae bacterium]
MFAGERARTLVDQCSRPEPGPVEGTWTPGAREIGELEAGLRAAFEAALLRQWPEDKVQPLDYYRQYGGLVIGGRQVVYVGGFHRSLVESEPQTNRDGSRFDWRAQSIGVCDGGPIVFGVEYDVEARTFRNFFFNGAID